GRVKTKKKWFWAVVAVVFGLVGGAQASTVTYLADGANSETVFAITGFTTCGGPGVDPSSGVLCPPLDMASLGTLTVTVNFVGGGSQTVTWVSGCGAACGSASGNFGNATLPGPHTGTWTLTETGDTGSVANGGQPNQTAVNAWVLTNTSTNTAILSVTLNGGLSGSGIVFDRDGPGPSPANLAVTTSTNQPQEGTPASALG